jgi:hypothetical protein
VEIYLLSPNTPHGVVFGYGKKSIRKKYQFSFRYYWLQGGTDVAWLQAYTVSKQGIMSLPYTRYWGETSSYRQS